MAGGVTLNVRQIGSYPAVGGAGPGDLLLMQPGGLGNPYTTIDARTLVATALAGGGTGALGAGVVAPGDALSSNIFTGNLIVPNDGGLRWNYYLNGGAKYWLTGLGAGFGWDEVGGFLFQLLPPGVAGAPVQGATSLFSISNAGAAALPYGTLTVARDPGAALEVATMGWVGNNTVVSFNGRKGAVTLNGCDVYAALCLNGQIATQPWVMAAIQSSTEMLLANHPFVYGWNGRTGAVWLTLADISCVFFQPGQKPITQTPPLTSNDYSIANTAWVVEYIANEFAGSGGNLATQSWVLANTVNSFNGRMGPVTLTGADVFDVGAAPLNGPNFSGIPTAPTAAVGQATGQIATTAFVQQAIAANVAGVSTFMGRSGDVVLLTADVQAAGGLTNPSPNLTGAPTCATAAPGTSSPQIANTQFVMAAIGAAVVSFNGRTGAVTLALADITGAGGAPLVSPNFSSVPTAPTAAPGTNTVQLATTAFVTAALAAAGGVSSFNGRTGVVDLIPNDISAAGGLVNPSVNLTGSPTATTATAGDNSQRIATTAFVTTAMTSGSVTSFNTRTGAVVLTAADLTAAGGALLAGPAFTGVPTAPTAAPATNNTQIATTAFVNAAIAGNTATVTSFNTRTGAVVLTTADIIGAGGAPIASPSFTGTPLGPTATAGTSTTQLATTAFVANAIATSGVSSFNSRTGAVTLLANDVSAAGGALLAGPAFTGVPTAPTAAPGTSSQQLATTAFVTGAIGAYLPLTGGTLSGNLVVNGNIGIQYSTFTGGGADGANHSYRFGWSGSNLVVDVDGVAPVQLANASQLGAYLPLSGGTINGALTVTGTGSSITATNQITGAYFVTENPAVQIWSSAGPNLTVSLPTPGGAINTMHVAAGVLTCDGAVRSYGNNISMATHGITYNAAGGGNEVAFIWSGGLQVMIDSTNVGLLQFQSSDATLKENFSPITVDPLAVVDKIPLQQFDWKQGLWDRPHWSCGFTAQDIQPLIPEAVTPCVGDGPLGVDLMPLLAYCIGAIQQLSARLTALEPA